MEQTDVLIFSVRIDQEDALKQSAELTKSIQDLTEQQKQLTAAGEGASTAYQENAVLLRTLKKEQSDVNRQLDNSVKSFNASNGSIQQQRANLSVLTQQYNKLSKEERENEQVGGKLAKQIKSLSNELKANESAIGDNRRSVGDYKGGILEATKSLNIFGVDVGGIADKLKNTKNSIDIAKAGFTGFDGVIKASALGVILLLVTGLIAAFSKFQPLVDKITFAFAGINAVIDVFVERLTRIGKGLVEILNGNFSEGINQVRESFDGMGSSMASAAKEAYGLAEALDELEDKNRAQLILNAEAKKSVDQLLLQAKNRTLSEQQRLKLLEQAGKIERENFEQNKKLQIDAYQIALKQAKLKTQLSEAEIEELLTNTKRREELEKRLGTLGDDALDKLAEQKAAIISLENETINVEEKIANRRDALIDAENQKRAKALEDRRKAEEAADKAFQDLFDKTEKANKDAGDKIIADREAAYQEALAQTTKFFTDQETARLNALANGQLTEAQFDAQQLAAKELQTQSLIELNRNFYKDTADLEKQAAQNAVDIKRAQANDEKAINDARLQAEQQTIGGLQTIANQASQLAGQQTETGKAFAIISATISTYDAATKAYASLAGIPVVGPALGAVASGLAIANGLSNVKRITETDTNAAAGGGTFYTKGPTMLLVGDNKGGREKVTVEPIASRGKTVVNRNSNLVKMAGGGTLVTDGGAYINEVTSKVNNQFNLKDLLANMPAPIVKVTDIDRVNSNRAKTAKVSQLS